MGFGSLQSLPTTSSALGGLVLSLPSMLGLNNPVVGIQPQNTFLPVNFPPSPSSEALVFNYEGEQTVLLESDITDHYIENNTSIQDQVAIRPEVITTHGFIGELNDILPSLLQSLQTTAASISVLGGYAPTLSLTAILALNKAAQAYQVSNSLANTAINAWNSISGGGVQNKQQKAYAKLYGWWQARTLMTVQTPWNLFLNCAIKSIRAIQDADTQLITDFEVTFKVLRFSSTVIAGGIQLGQSYFNNYTQQNNPTQLGSSTPTNTGASLSSNFHLIGG